MNNKTKIAVVGIVFAVIALMVWLLSGTRGELTQQKYKGQKLKPSYISSTWDEGYYDLTNKDPFGLYLLNFGIKERLNKNIEVSKIDHLYSLDTLKENQLPTFIFVGEKFILNPEELDSVLSRVEKGSKLFLSADVIDKKMYWELFDNVGLSYIYSEEVEVSVGKNKYEFQFILQNDTIAHNWKGYKNLLTVSNKRHKTLATIGSLESNITLQYGKGYIYLNPNPDMYTNVQLKSKAGYYHSKIWVNRIPKDQPVYWLEIARFKDLPEDDFDDLFDNEGEGERDDSYLQYIFEKPQLVTAMILAIIGILLFILFRAKRTQPMVPFIGKKKNMSIEFADTITSIYFSKRNPYVLLQVQKRNFYNAIQKHFYVDLSKRHEDREIITLSQKSNIHRSEIEELLIGLEVSKESAVDENYLIELTKKQVDFYRRTGMISQRVQSKIDARVFKFYRNYWLSTVLILGGILILLLGMYYLAQSFGIGIVFWPIGIAVITWGSLRLGKPKIEIDDKLIKVYPLFGKPITFEKQDLIAIQSSSNGARLTFAGNKHITINYWELSNLDARQFKRFVQTQNKLEL